MGNLVRRLGRLEDTMIQRDIDRQMAGLARVTEVLGLPAFCLPEMRHCLEDYARAEAAHGPMAPDELESAIQREAQQVANRTGMTVDEVLAEAERIGELWESLT